MEQYNEKTMQHFMSPKNMGEIADADGVGRVGNLKCGDVMEISIRVETRKKKSEIPARNCFATCDAGGRNPKSLPEVASQHAMQAGETNLNIKNSNDKTGTEEYIKDIKFKTLGCAAAIASSSMTTELAKDKSLDEALKISRDDINEALGKLPAPKYHCSILAADGIKKAIEDYRSRKNC